MARTGALRRSRDARSAMRAHVLRAANARVMYPSGAIDDEDDLTDDVAEVKELIRKHVKYAGSTLGREVLDQWGKFQPMFVKIMPRDYKRALGAIQRAKELGIPWEEAVMEGAHG